jgi:hypothetical protein
MRPILLAIMAAAALAGSAAAAPVGPQIITGDVDLFYRLYDAAGGHPTAEMLQRDYIDAGSAGVREFVPSRILSGERLAQKIAEKPEVYAKARACAGVLPKVKARLVPAFRKLAALYPEARFPPVTVLIGRNNSGGTTGPTGVLIGLEVVCATVRPGETLENRFFHLIAHEYGHVEQGPEPEQPTLLDQSLREGVAELVAELTTGAVGNTHLIAWNKGHEREVGEAFLKQAHGTDAKAWLYNGVGTPEQPGDQGYWVGWRIARAYYHRAKDKRAALRTLLEQKDSEAILRDSGWKPGD